MSKPVWYFDFVSPYAYLQFAAYPTLFSRPDVVLTPLVFAGLLKHWGHKGPAEIASKRIHTYRSVVWQARHLGIPFTMPPAHPFNPVPALRLALALNCSYAALRTIFEFIWKEGRSLTVEWPALCARLGVDDADALIAQTAIKDRLRGNGEAALTAGVFGVPTFVVDGQIFWGVDSTPMLLEYLENPQLFDDAEMRRAASLPVAVHRQS